MRRAAASWLGTSLLSRLLRGMVLPMVCLALLLGIGGAIAIHDAVETLNDRILGAASRAIAESLTVEDGGIALNLSPAIFGMLEDAERDNVYYRISAGGRTLTGYGDLPTIAPHGLRDTQVMFGDASYHGLPVRIVAEGRRLSGVSAVATVEVAETLGARRRTERRLLIGLALLEAALIGMSVMLLPLAIRWGMRPLTILSAAMDRRLAVDLTPLSQDDVPAELGELIAAFNGMLLRLDAALQRMRRFTADASHQLRTPLSILRAHIAVLRDGDSDSDSDSDADAARQSIDDIDRASERLQRLVVQLLTMARADNAELSPAVLELTDLNRLAADVAADHAPAAVMRDIELHFEPFDGPAIVATQPLLAAEMMGNFIDNAVAYGRDGGNVLVAVRSRANRFEIVVEDDGPGIPIADRPRMLTRFARLDRDSPRTGSGLGLPIAETLARSIGVTFTLETAHSGQGLLVRIVFATDSIVTA